MMSTSPQDAPTSKSLSAPQNGMNLPEIPDTFLGPSKPAEEAMHSEGLMQAYCQHLEQSRLMDKEAEMKAHEVLNLKYYQLQEQVLEATKESGMRYRQLQDDSDLRHRQLQQDASRNKEESDMRHLQLQEALNSHNEEQEARYNEIQLIKEDVRILMNHFRSDRASKPDLPASVLQVVDEIVSSNDGTRGDHNETSTKEFLDVEGGGSLILAWQIKNKRVLVVGGGEVAAGRILNVLNADAKVTVVSPRDGLNPEVAYRIKKGQVDYVDRKFEPSDLDGVDMVLTAVDDPVASTVIWKLCKERKIAANIADVPAECDFYFGSVHRDGPLQIMVSTNGKGPRLANIVRRSIVAILPKNVGEAILKVGKLRQMLRSIAPRPEEGPKRMAWMIKVSDAYSLDDFCEMDEEDMEALLEYYIPDKVPRLACLRAMKNRYDAFDGSFGFCVGF